MKSLLDELSVAEVKSRIENSIRKNNKQFIGLIVVLSILVAAGVTLLILKLVKAKRFNDWFDDDFYDDFDDDDLDEDFDIEIKNEEKA